MMLIIIGAFVLLDRLMQSINTLGEENKRKLDLEKLSKDAELAMLRQQLQPHFLFNTLNSISALVVSQPEEARRMIQLLSDFLRGTVKKDDQQFVAFSSELEQINLYLNIEKVRFGNRLHTIVEADEACNDLQVPPLLLQPLVENAVKFGLYGTIDAVAIRVSAKTENRQLKIRIENPFDAEGARPIRGTGFGLSSVQRRLYLLFSRNDLLRTQVKENIFVVSLKIPQQT
jgi:two-component system LytT family sensor kinase